MKTQLLMLCFAPILLLSSCSGCSNTNVSTSSQSSSTTISSETSSSETSSSEESIIDPTVGLNKLLAFDNLTYNQTVNTKNTGMDSASPDDCFEYNYQTEEITLQKDDKGSMHGTEEPYYEKVDRALEAVLIEMSGDSETTDEEIISYMDSQKEYIFSYLGTVTTTVDRTNNRVVVENNIEKGVNKYQTHYLYNSTKDQFVEIDETNDVSYSTYHNYNGAIDAMKSDLAFIANDLLEDGVFDTASKKMVVEGTKEHKRYGSTFTFSDISMTFGDDSLPVSATYKFSISYGDFGSESTISVNFSNWDNTSFTYPSYTVPTCTDHGTTTHYDDLGEEGCREYCAECNEYLAETTTHSYFSEEKVCSHCGHVKGGVEYTYEKYYEIFDKNPGNLYKVSTNIVYADHYHLDGSFTYGYDSNRYYSTDKVMILDVAQTPSKADGSNVTYTTHNVTIISNITLTQSQFEEACALTVEEILATYPDAVNEGSETLIAYELA